MGAVLFLDSYCIGAFCADSKFQISSSWAKCLFFETQRLLMDPSGITI